MKNKLLKLVLTSTLLFGCTPKNVAEQARSWGTKEFTPQSWAVATQEERAEMVFSLLQQHPPTKLKSKDIQDLLGTPTGYYDHDENPAYFVGPKTVESEFGKGYLLVFLTNKATGKIDALKILPEPQ